MKRLRRCASAVALLLIACGCGGNNRGGSVPPGPSSNSPGGSTGDAGTATLGYWDGFNSLAAQLAPEMRGGPRQQVWAFREAARVIRQSPTLGVDPDLTDWAQRVATLFDQRADLIEISGDPALLAEAFLRGMQGDPFGVGIELNQAERTWVANFRSITREQYRLRARLTARYGIEFPSP